MENPFKTLKAPIQRLAPKDYGSRFIAMGGEHMVFTFELPFQPKDKSRKARPRTVVGKVNFRELMPVVEAELAGNTSRVEDVLEATRLRNELKMSQMAAMRGYFGPDSVPAQQFMLRDVPVSREAVWTLNPNLAHKPWSIDKIKAWVSVQQKVDLPPDWTLSLTGYYPESPASRLRLASKDFEEKYDRGHEILVGGLLSEFDHETQVQAALDLYPELKAVASQAENSPEFKVKLKEVARQMIDFLDDNDIPLELAGDNNVVLTKGEDGWKVKLMDALPLPGCTFGSFKKIIGKAARSEGLNPHEAGVALNVLNTVRVVNALAIISNIPDRLRVFGLQGIPAETWRQEIITQIFHR